MASIVVFIGFLVLRGRGIKLTSFIAKEWKNNTLIPVLQKKIIIVAMKVLSFLNQNVDFILKIQLHVDYSSLYVLISENLCPQASMDKEFDLKSLIRDTEQKR